MARTKKQQTNGSATANAEGKGEAEFAHDVEFLSRLWSQIRSRYESATPPAALHEEGDLTFRVVRDLFSPEVEFLSDAKVVLTLVDGAPVFADPDGIDW